jgi:hypothetical protein
LGAASVLALALSGVAAQEVKTSIGTLTCTLSADPIERKAGAEELRDMSCLFKPTGDGAEIAYTGTIVKAGPASLPGGKIVLIWSVIGPKGPDADHTALAQRFVGQTGPADQTGAGVLIGQTDRSYGLNAITNATASPRLAVTVVDLKLKTVPA